MVLISELALKIKFLPHGTETRDWAGNGRRKSRPNLWRICGQSAEQSAPGSCSVEEDRDPWAVLGDPDRIALFGHLFTQRQALRVWGRGPGTSWDPADSTKNKREANAVFLMPTAY